MKGPRPRPTARDTIDGLTHAVEDLDKAMDPVDDADELCVNYVGIRRAMVGAIEIVREPPRALAAARGKKERRRSDDEEEEEGEEEDR